MVQGEGRREGGNRGEEGGEKVNDTHVWQEVCTYIRICKIWSEGGVGDQLVLTDYTRCATV